MMNVGFIGFGMMNNLKEKGLEKCDHSALVQYYESRAGVEVKRI